MVRDVRWAAVAVALCACDRPGLLAEGPQLRLSAASLAFEGGRGYDPAPRQVLATRAAPGAVLSGLSVDYGGGPSGWLSVAWSDPSTSPVALTVRPQAAQLPPGTHRATIFVAAAGAANSPVALPVIVQVPPPRPAASPPTLFFSGPADGRPPPQEILLVSNAGGGALPRPTVALDDLTGSPPTWVRASVRGESEPYEVVLEFSEPLPTTYSSFAANIAAAGESASVYGTFFPATPLVQISPGRLVFFFTPGGSDPAPRTAQVLNAGGGSMAAPLATLPGGETWLTVSVNGTAPPYTLGVSPIRSVIRGLPTGTYLASVAVQSPDALVSTTLPVWLEVGASPSVAWAAAPQALSFRTLAGEDPAPLSARVDLASGIAAGAPTLQVQALHGGSADWLSADLLGAVPPFELRLRPRGAGLAPGYYQALVQLLGPGPSVAEYVQVGLLVNGWEFLDSTPCAVLNFALATATSLPDGQVLATGLAGPPRDYLLPCASTFSTVNRRWSDTNPPPALRSEHSATLLGDGRVLVAGGLEQPAALESGGWEVYDPSTRLWLPGPVPLSPRRQHVAALLPDGRVLLAGGLTGATALASAELLDPLAGLPAPAAPLATARERASAVTLADWRLLVAGGAGADGSPLSSAEIYDPATGSWGTVGAMGAGRIAPALVLLGDGRVLAAGGSNGAAPLSSAELFDPATGRWTPTGSMAAGRATVGLLLPDGHVLVMGGTPAAQVATAAGERYDPVAGSWSAASAASALYGGHSLSLLPGGRVLLSGGCSTADCNGTFSMVGRGVAP